MIAALFEGRDPDVLLSEAIARFRCISWLVLSPRQHLYNDIITAGTINDGKDSAAELFGHSALRASMEATDGQSTWKICFTTKLFWELRFLELAGVSGAAWNWAQPQVASSKDIETFVMGICCDDSAQLFSNGSIV